ncbi:DUF2624 family protein [Bacillus badius]|uniref:tRNA methyltransferase n=1 Tax=Bacillus badius TaxID=1455 RepID=A0ABR5AY73_BACBA|nr:DUF2624 family protein [Bacillus badius]KIL75323.1 hypothetical protein SD78_2392 [Bacillus badius]KIL79688.1 hypothetical protein SD77_2142 [Bacillus badius]KZN98812.1 hypothetical protein A4244_06810 [Bacillus badius]KZR60452.1 hypothetical protein A3781_09805 [Bacillus badius]MED0664728.1 DUF2624 family protein [Bacillus badius]
MKFLQHLINQKAQTITADELLNYAKGLDIPLKREEAEKVSSLLRRQKVNLFNEQARASLLREIAAITNEQTANKLNKLLTTFLQ